MSLFHISSFPGHQATRHGKTGKGRVQGVAHIRGQVPPSIYEESHPAACRPGFPLPHFSVAQVNGSRSSDLAAQRTKQHKTTLPRMACGGGSVQAPIHSPDVPRGVPPPRRFNLGMAAAYNGSISARLLLALRHRGLGLWFYFLPFVGRQ